MGNDIPKFNLSSLKQLLKSHGMSTRESSKIAKAFQKEIKTTLENGGVVVIPKCFSISASIKEAAETKDFGGASLPRRIKLAIKKSKELVPLDAPNKPVNLERFLWD